MDTMKWRQRRSLGNVEKSIEEEKEEGKTRPVYIRSHSIRNSYHFTVTFISLQMKKTVPLGFPKMAKLLPHYASRRLILCHRD